MPTNKDFKRLVRTRMRKTGEAYTTARVHLLKAKPTPARTLAAAHLAKIAGHSDAAIKEKTGRTWEGWVKALDHIGAETWPHREIARHVHEECGVPGWWSQTVTVGYERIKGRRVVGQRVDGTFEANKSKTYSVSVSRLYRAWNDPRQRARWLPGVPLEVRSSSPEKVLRFTWPDRTSVVVGFTAKGPEKSQVAVQHGKLAGKAALTAMKAYWEERLMALEAMLE